MMMKQYLKCFLISGAVIASLFISSCKKDWLDANPDKSKIIPETLEDVQGLLNNAIYYKPDPVLGEVGAGDYTLSDSQLPNLSVFERNAYLWKADIFENSSKSSDWSNSYEQILTINVALEVLAKVGVNDNNRIEINRLKGVGLFYRSWCLFALMGVFAKPFDPVTASSDLGIPLRLHSDINEEIGRSSVQECYDKITSDLKQSADLIGNTEKEDKLRASKESIYGLLARVYLSMGDYDQAFHYADECLKLYHNLLDYNILDLDADYPFAKLNSEVIYSKSLLSYFGITYYTRIDKHLYDSYNTGDLRKRLFFKLREDGGVKFKGSYRSSSDLFCGIATDELYLTRAECYARRGNTTLAMKDLNDLLRTRWVYKPGTTESSYVDLTAQNEDDALTQILTERRKELLMRGIRWIDLRRLNKDPRFAKTLTRTFNGKVYTLPANSNRYVYPIPRDEVEVSGIPQNSRD